MSVLPFERPVPGRELSSWIDYFVEHTNGIQSQRIFRQWAAISTVAAALERKVHIISQGRPVFPNLYIFLVGPPGSGKTRAVDESEDIFRALKSHKIAPTSMTKASLIDALKESERAIPGQIEGTFNALYLAAKELGALLPGYDTDFMNALVYLYDSIPYGEKRRSKDISFTIDKPLLNLIACTTPSFLNEMLPLGAWEQGFLSRVVIAYSDILEDTKLDLLQETKPRDPTLTKALEKDLVHIGQRIGRYQFDREAALAMESWNDDRRKTEPAHPRLTHYNTRRPLQLLKLTQIAAADRGSNTIGILDVQRAQNWLTEVEGGMHDIFTAMTYGGDARVTNELHHYVIVQQTREGKVVQLADVFRFLQSRVPSHNVQRIINMMFQTGLLEPRSGGVWARPASP